MIEGLIILAIAAIVIVVALFGTTIYAGFASVGASISAVIGGVITGGATLLTAWWDWSTASYTFTNYIGIAWLSVWGALFAFCGFKIATSDKKKWMNLVGKGSNYLGIALIVFLVAQPLIVSAGATYLSDTTAYTEIEYNVTLQADSYYNVIQACRTNATAEYSELQSVTYDNSTSEQIVASLDYDAVTAITTSRILAHLNISFLSTETVSKITIGWFYVGTGNLTSISINGQGLSVLNAWDDETLGTNGTVNFIPEAFQAQTIKTITNWNTQFIFADTTDLPSDGDYFSFYVKFYKTATVIDQATIMFWLAAIITAMDFIALLYATGLGEKYLW